MNNYDYNPAFRLGIQDITIIPGFSPDCSAKQNLFLCEIQSWLKPGKSYGMVIPMLKHGVNIFWRRHLRRRSGLFGFSAHTAEKENAGLSWERPGEKIYNHNFKS
jgi:hypothetical protein